MFIQVDAMGLPNVLDSEVSLFELQILEIPRVKVWRLIEDDIQSNMPFSRASSGFLSRGMDFVTISISAKFCIWPQNNSSNYPLKQP